MKIKLENVRLSFPYLFTAQEQEGGKKTFNASFILKAGDPQIEKIERERDRDHRRRHDRPDHRRRRDHDRVIRVDRPDRPERRDRPERPERRDRPERPARPDRPVRR